MKKTISIMLCIFMLLGTVMTGSVAANAETLKSGEFEYTVLTDGSVEITNYTGTDTDVVIPETLDEKTVTSLNLHVSKFGYAFETITLPKSITNIDNSMFCAIENLKSITVSEESETYSSLDGVLFNKKRTVLIAYPIAKKGESYTVIGKVKKIGTSAFENTHLKSVLLYNRVKKIESNAFKNSAIKAIRLSNRLEYIGNTAFAGTNLTSIYIPRSVTKIGKLAFGRKASAHLEEYTVYGCKDSYAQKYCKKNNIDFKAVDPVAPKKTTVKGGKGKVTIKYKKVKKARGFQVKITQNGKSVTETFITKKSVTRAVKGLKKGKCKVKVRTYRRFDGKAVYSKWTKAKTVKVK